MSFLLKHQNLLFFTYKNVNSSMNIIYKDSLRVGRSLILNGYLLLQSIVTPPRVVSSAVYISLSFSMCVYIFSIIIIWTFSDAKIVVA